MSDEPKVVSVKIAKPPPPPPTEAQEAPADASAPSAPNMMQQSGWPQQPCILTGLSSAVGAGVLGFVFGAVPSMLRNRRLSAWQLWAMDGWRSTLGLGVVSGMYTWVHCLATRIRLKDDGWNRGLAGCATGLVLGWQGGPMSAAQSCAGLGLVSYIVDFAGAGETPAAHAADLDPIHWEVYSGPGAQTQAQAHRHACVGACCEHDLLPHGNGSTTAGLAACSGCSPTALSLALTAIAQAACTLAGASPPHPSHGSTGRPSVTQPGSKQLGHSEEGRAAAALQRARASGHPRATNVSTADGVAPCSAAAASPGSALPATEAPHSTSTATTPTTGATGALASITGGHGAGWGAARGAAAARQVHGPERHAAEAAGRGMALLAWPGPMGRGQLPPVMWLGHVLARPYFNQVQ